VTGAVQPATDDATAIASALWGAWRQDAPLPEASPGLRGAYIREIYRPVVRRRRRAVWEHGSGEPWQTLQWGLEAVRGRGRSHSDTRLEGFPRFEPGVRYGPEISYRGIVNGEYQAPFLFVAGYPRSATTSMQNLLLTAFRPHIPAGIWADPSCPLHLWDGPKHDPVTARRLASLGSQAALVLLCMRRFPDAVSSFALYYGRDDADAITPDWLNNEVERWLAMADLRDLPGCRVLDFDTITKDDPANVVRQLAGLLDMATSPEFDARETGESLYVDGVSEDVQGRVDRGNLPNADRRMVSARIRERVLSLLGGRADELEAVYSASIGTKPTA
jgi:hypothetical protein